MREIHCGGRCSRPSRYSHLGVIPTVARRGVVIAVMVVRPQSAQRQAIKEGESAPLAHSLIGREGASAKFEAKDKQRQ
jgi:hypothetical protein